MDAYEEARRQAIAAKAAIAQELGIADQKRAIETVVEEQQSARKRARTERSLSKSRQSKPAAVLPRRRSSRRMGLDPEGNPVPPPAARQAQTLESIVPSHPGGAPKLGDRSLPVFLNAEEDQVGHAQAMMQSLAKSSGKHTYTFTSGDDAGGSTASRAEISARFKGKSCLDYSSMRIRSDDHVAKCVPSRIYSTIWHPRADSAVLWVGDRWGKLGAWRPLEEDDDACVTELFVHNRAISGLLPLRSDPTQVFTASYDRTVRCLDAVTETSVCCAMWDELLYGVEAPDDGSVLFASTARGELLRVDRREGPRAVAQALRTKRAAGKGSDAAVPAASSSSSSSSSAAAAASSSSSSSSSSGSPRRSSPRRQAAASGAGADDGPGGARADDGPGGGASVGRKRKRGEEEEGEARGEGKEAKGGAGKDEEVKEEKGEAATVLHSVQGGTPAYTAPRFISIHERKTGSISLHPDGHRLLSCAMDSTACIWDIRKWPSTPVIPAGGDKKHPVDTTDEGSADWQHISKPGAFQPLATMTHKNSVTSGYFSPTGKKFVVTCNDDTIRVFDTKACLSGGAGAVGGAAGKGKGKGAGPQATVVIRHNNHTGRWLSNFRTVWDPRGDDVVLVGAMKTRQVEVFDASSGQRLHAFADPDRMTAVPTLNAVHPVLPFLGATTASGRVHLWQCD